MWFRDRKWSGQSLTSLTACYGPENCEAPMRDAQCYWKECTEGNQEKLEVHVVTELLVED